MFYTVDRTATTVTLPAGTYTEWRIIGPNSGGKAFIATEDEAAEVFSQFDRYVQYGHVHTMVSRTVTVGDWA